MPMFSRTDMTSPTGPRAVVSGGEGAIHVAFPPPFCRWSARVGLPFWVGMFVFGLAAMAWELPTGIANTPVNNAAESVFLITLLLIFVSMWVMTGALGARHLLMQGAGRELMMIDNARLTWRREMPVLSRTRTYELPEVRNLRALHSIVPFWVSCWYASSRYGWDIFGLTGGVIAFDYRRETVYIGGGIDEAEAKSLVARILQLFPSLGIAGR